MDRAEFIKEVKRLISIGEMTDVESYVRTLDTSRTKARTDLESQEWDKITIRKRIIYIKK